jgi:hypothetical protein
MSLFVCEKCQTIENTALGKYWGENKKLCSECGWEKWHGRFEKEKFDPKKWKYQDKQKDSFVERVNN